MGKNNLDQNNPTFARDLGLFDATMIGAGAMIGGGIFLAAIERHNAEALVMGWKGYTNASDRIFGEIADKIIRYAPCDLMVVKLGTEKKIDNCLLPTYLMHNLLPKY